MCLYLDGSKECTDYGDDCDNKRQLFKLWLCGYLVTTIRKPDFTKEKLKHSRRSVKEHRLKAHAFHSFFTLTL